MTSVASTAVIPYLVVRDAERIASFLERAFGATSISSTPRPDGRIKHARLRIGDALVMLAEATDTWGPMRSCVCIYVDDVDATYAAALAAGGRSLLPPGDRSFGERNAGVADPADGEWWISRVLGEAVRPAG